jgi:ubiquitin C-terminal hydrolase
MQKLDAANKFTCEDGCRQSTRATRRIRLVAAPVVLAVTLKRFTFTEVDPGRKNSAKVTFKETLRIKVRANYFRRAGVLLHLVFDAPPLSCRYVVLSSWRAQDAWFVLTGVVEHVGPYIDGGHYFAFVRGRKPPHGSPTMPTRWFKCNDSSVEEVC